MIEKIKKEIIWKITDIKKVCEKYGIKIED